MGRGRYFQKSLHEKSKQGEIPGLPTIKEDISTQKAFCQHSGFFSDPHNRTQLLRDDQIRLQVGWGGRTLPGREDDGAKDGAFVNMGFSQKPSHCEHFCQDSGNETVVFGSGFFCVTESLRNSSAIRTNISVNNLSVSGTR